LKCIGNHYQFYSNNKTELDQYLLRERIIKENNEYDAYCQLQQLYIVDEINVHLEYMKDIDTRRKIDDFNINLIGIETKIKKYVVDIKSIESKLQSKRIQLHDIQNVIKQNNDNKLKLNQYEINETHSISKMELLTETLNIFHPECLSFQILSDYLKIFCQHVNKLFTSLIGYEFSFAQEKNKLNFYVDGDRDPLTLSGYESITLQIAINNALEGLIGGKFLIVDESFDCVDQERFKTELPKTINIIRKYYQSILLISHRDLPDSIIDKNIKIRPMKSYSMIC
jgi:hypothetical protein